MIGKYFTKNAPNWGVIILNLVPFVKEMFTYWLRTKERNNKLINIRTAIDYYSPEAKAGTLIEKIEKILNEVST